ncbi:C5a anaphylatoxin chemotactic receptor 1-like isoform 1-T2 [Anomaloglossus baeobatrachus]|uniref:C5a anaphylatoxin chemotactic receptor 1-like n=1 Tax=Anomaloglossus baeobatrachus TaxID=238106 RepID=UPI003F50880C
METSWNDSFDYDYDENSTFPPSFFPKNKNDPLSVTDWVSIFQYLLVFILGVPGNSLVVWITAFEMKRSVNTIWFQNLAVADLLCCISVPFSIMNISLGYWPLGLFACKLIPSILLINMYASVLLLTMISIDRCALVMKPVWCQNSRTLRKAYLACAILWILAIILSSPNLIFRHVKEHEGKLKCLLDYSILKHQRQKVEDSIATCRLLLGFVFPFLVIIGCYTLLIHRVKLRFTQNTKTMKVSIVVIIGFFVCWLPYHVSGTIIAMHAVSSPFYNPTLNLFHIFIALAFMNSCINPIIYVLVGQDFKSKFKRSVKGILKDVLEEEDITPESADSNRTNLTSESKNTDTSI